MKYSTCWWATIRGCKSPWKVLRTGKTNWSFPGWFTSNYIVLPPPTIFHRVGQLTMELQAFSHWTYEEVTSTLQIINIFNWNFLRWILWLSICKEQIIVTTVRWQILKPTAKLITCQVGFERFFDTHVCNWMCQLSNTEFERETKNLNIAKGTTDPRVEFIFPK